MKREIDITQEKSLKEFKDLWNDFDDPVFNINSDEEAINICISIAAMFMRNKEARTAFYQIADPLNN